MADRDQTLVRSKCSNLWTISLKLSERLIAAAHLSSNFSLALAHMVSLGSQNSSRNISPTSTHQAIPQSRHNASLTCWFRSFGPWSSRSFGHLATTALRRSIDHRIFSTRTKEKSAQ